MAENTQRTTQIEAEAVTENKAAEAGDLDMTGYHMVWEDEFDGEELNREDWNVELHEKGWVNNEWQEYVDSDENIFLKDGKLVLKPKKNEDGTYTSGRVNTQGKHDTTYGLFEATIKMPKGKGFLPAFWLMSSDENIYGQWPRCGEIDIAEVVGLETKTTYGTIHYGNPHNQDQGTYTLTDGDFSEEFHTYSLEWLPGKLNWYVDGHLMHTADNWYSRTEGVGEITYPAPFDQPFYVILNLAVGGDWPGDPDETTDFENSTMEIESVRIYQKDSYDENVQAPQADTSSFREPDASGNYIVNGDFSEDENLFDEEGWKFLIANGGQGQPEIKDHTMVITSTATGDVPYGVQLVQPDIPVIKGATYRVSFDAWADEERTMETAVTAPNAGWIRYMEDTTTELTTEKQAFSYEFTVTADSDPTGRMEFNMGNTPSTATIYIQNVRVEKLSDETAAEAKKKTVLADGNYVYNSKFQEGEMHLGSWEITNDADASIEVTPLADGRRLHAANASKAAPEAVVVQQRGLDLVEKTNYLLTFDAESAEDTELTIAVGGRKEVFPLKAAEGETQKLAFQLENADATDLVFYLGDQKEIYIDNVRIVEDVMIKNGSFNAGFTGYEVFVDSSAKASYVVDSQTEDNAADFLIDDQGSEDWNIQLKQNQVPLEKGKKYRLSVAAKSSAPRKIRVLMQGGEDKGWPIYSGENTVALTTDYQTFTLDFEMTEASDPEAFLSICLGVVDGEKIDGQHRVCIDNITLEEVK